MRVRPRPTVEVTVRLRLGFGARVRDPTGLPMASPTWSRALVFLHV